jgi:hypothetical protein
MIAMIQKSMVNSFDPVQLDKAFAAILVFEYPTQEPESPSIWTPILSGVGGFFVGRKLHDLKLPAGL